jgi:hypothetical protein
MGTCESRSRSCFPETLVRVGTPDPPVDGASHPTLVGTFCVGSTHPDANSVAGLAGPGALVLPVDVQFKP